MKQPTFSFNDPAFLEEVSRNPWRIPTGGDRMMDIGASRGGVSALAALNGMKEVVAYEPDPIAFPILSQTIIKNGLEEKIHPIQAAVHLQSGRSRFTFNNIKDERQIVNGRLAELGEKDDQESEVTTIAISEALGNKLWDVVKIDIEGYEFPLLTQCPEDIFLRIKFLTMELHYTFSPTTAQYDRLIARLENQFSIDGPKNAVGKFSAVFATNRFIQ